MSNGLLLDKEQLWLLWIELLLSWKSATLPAGSNHAQAWRKAAVDAGLSPSPTRVWTPPTIDRFLEAIMLTSGAAGFDGWCKEEVRALISFAPWIIEEIYVLLIRTMREAPSGLPDAVRDAVFIWRVVGIPKRDPGESGPIAIASFFLRALQKTVLDSLPAAPDGQWGEIGVVPAVASYLAWGDALPSAGAELDLAKAYDSILHGPAAEAFRFEGTPIEVVACLEHAWTAQRICNVGGELASPILPTSGILLGDPTSGRVLSVLLKPWHHIMITKGVHPAAYADDRSIKAIGTDCDDAEAKVAEALLATAAFDKSIDFIEN